MLYVNWERRNIVTNQSSGNQFRDDEIIILLQLRDGKASEWHRSKGIIQSPRYLIRSASRLGKLTLYISSQNRLCGRLPGQETDKPRIGATGNETAYTGNRRILRGFSSKILVFSAALTSMSSMDLMVSQMNLFPD